MRRLIYLTVLVGLVAGPAMALHPGTEIVVPAAGRGSGAGGSLWVTSLYVLNPNQADVEVTFGWLVRDQANPSPLTATRVIEGGQTLVLDDAIVDLFGLDSAGGAFLVAAPSPVVVNAGIFNRAGGKEYGQGFEGMPTTVGVGAGETTHAIGIINNSAYRTNFFIADVSGEGSTVLAEIVDANGQVLGGTTYTLGAYEPILKKVGDLTATAVDQGMVRFTVQSGSVLVGSSRVNEGTGDPLTLGAWWGCGGASSTEGWAPESLAGLELEMEVTPIECDMEPFTEAVGIQVLSDTEISVDVYGSTMTIPIAGYTRSGNLGYIETSLPSWNITDTTVTMIWTSATVGRFTGAATDYDGSPIQFSGIFEVVSR